ncbi:hypothetical protein ACOMHN_041082 [Nucella lapillus]
MEKHGYESRRIIGEGTYGMVLEVKEKMTDKKMAVKLVESLKDAELEIRINKFFQLDCPDFILTLYMSSTSVAYSKSFVPVRLIDDFKIESGICMVFELMKGGNLHGWVDGHRPSGVSLKEFKILAIRMFKALEFLEEKMIIHGDIKSNNFLLDNPSDPSTLKLCDFGLSDKLPRYQIPMLYPEQFITRPFRPPEVMLRTYTYSTMAPDMWGVGCVLLHILLGDTFFNPSDDATNMAMVDDIFTVLGRPTQLMLERSKHRWDLPRDPAEYPKDSKRLLYYLMKRKPSWMRSEAIYVYDLVRRTLELFPDKRISPRDALNHPFIKQ